MKQKYSGKWVGSKQPRKQRKFRANAPMHVRHKMMSSNLSKELRKKYGKRNIPIHKGDSIRIMSGGFKGKTGKIDSVDLKKMRVMIDGIYRTKKDGTKVSVYFNASNLQIKELNLEDKMRKKALERKVGVEKKKEFKAKPLPKTEEKDSTTPKSNDEDKSNLMKDKASESGSEKGSVNTNNKSKEEGK